MTMSFHADVVSARGGVILDQLAATISGAVVNDDEFDSYTGFAEDFGDKTTEGLCGVKNGNNDANLDHGLLVLLNERHLIFVPFDRDFSSFSDFQVGVIQTGIAQLLIQPQQPFNDISFFITSSTSLHAGYPC